MSGPVEIVVREAAESDLEAVLSLYSDQLAYHHDFDPEWDASWPDSPAAKIHFCRYLADKHRFLAVAETGVSVIAYVLGKINNAPAAATFPKIATLESMHVSSSYRGMGAGQMLVRRFIDFSRDHKASRLMLEVTVGNDRSIEFYRQLGFEDYTINMCMALD